MTAILPHSQWGSRNISERRRRQVFTDPTDRVHGTPSGYTYGCRCDRCKTAHHTYAVALKARKRAQGLV